MVEKFWVDILDALNRLIVNLILQVLLGHLISELFCSRDPLYTLTFLQSRRVDVLFLGYGEHEHVVEQLLQHLEQVFLLLWQQRFVQDVLHKFLLQDDQLIHVTHLFQAINEDGPGWFKHLNQNVVVNVCYKVRHFVVSQIYAMKFGLQLCGQSSEWFLVCHGETPRLCQQVLQTLHSQHKLEYLAIWGHNVFGEDSGERGQIWDFIIEEEHFPATIFLIRLQQLHIESTDKLLRVILRIRRPDSSI